ncbi:acyl carrier protein [Amycolatopsis sp. CA-230715]|uniref:acyl carrier protein n=1 Tax=Amycolatopsis sp. CA-230715 TaxID=2745196 RepID=UPI001C0326A0|nr:acyl carrier protein [Amycolatopsis sp. CA-230715]QWF84832.1 hypothetical protein HUW46_08284 [Amycolatopsis sp. CA-230715]
MERQRKMIDVWSEVFKKPVTAETDFFDDLEGDSMTAAAVAHWAGLEFGVTVPIEEVFERPTPAELTAYVDELLAG